MKRNLCNCRGDTTLENNFCPCHDNVIMKLLRNFIEEALYARTTGYFNSSPNRLGNVPLIDFASLQGGKSDYQTILDNHSESAWFTPSELFKPWYGYIIADQIIKTAITDKIIIYEVGAGTGSLALSIIERLKECGKACEYTTIEISKVFADVQRSKGLNVIERSFMHLKDTEHRPCFVLALEVWDNLAHDRMRLFDTFQAVFDKELEEQYVPMTDQCLIECVKVIDVCYPKYLETGWVDRFLTRTAFIPTGLFQFLKTLKECFPDGQLIVSDFDKLPTMQEGRCAPRVQIHEQGETVELSRMAFCPGRADIFFPIHFHLAQALLSYLCNHESIVMKSKAFLSASPHALQTKTPRRGFNPMLDTYHNSSFLFSKPRKP